MAEKEAVGVPLLTSYPDELFVYIEELETWRESVDKRKDSTRARRSQSANEAWVKLVSYVTE